MQEFEQHFPYFSSFSEELKEHFISILNMQHLERGEMLLQEGRLCNKIYFLHKGLARGFYHRNGKELTSWFAIEGDVITSMTAFVQQKTSNENIEMLEDSVLYSITYQQLQEMYNAFPEFNQLGRVLMEKYYIELEEHTLSLQFDSAKQRYNDLLSKKGYLLNRVHLKYIASYLGISQETLSRIRSKIS